MTSVHGKDTLIYMGAYNIGQYANDVSMSRTADTAETSTFGVASKTYIVGQLDGSFSMSGIWDGAVGAIDDRLAATFGTASNVLTYFPNLDTIGNAAYLMSGIHTSYEVDGSIGDAVAWSAEVQPSGGIDAGKSLHALSAISATGNYTSVNNGAATSNGYAANIHVTSVTGSPTTTTIRITDSADNSTFAALATACTFTNITAVTSEQKTGTGAVRQYVRCETTALSGGTSPTVTFAVAFARR